MKTINEERLFAQLPYFFDRPSGVLIELAQNAQRAGATRMDITLEGDVLTVIDDGHGTDNVEALFCLASSDWSEKVEAEQMPAGWGLFFLMAISRTITYLSRFGKITVNCEAYLRNKSYRQALLSLVDDSGRLRGMRIQATLKKDVVRQLDVAYTANRSLAWFPIALNVNGDKIDRKVADKEFDGYRIKTTYQGNKVWINPLDVYSASSRVIIDHTTVIWYGMPIFGTTYDNWIAIEVAEGSPLTPVLPYRTSVQHDTKGEAFAEFIRKELVGFCTSAINSYKDEDPVWPILRLMKTAANVMTQEELDQLNVFFVTAEEPYYRRELDPSPVYRIIRRGSPAVISETARILLFSVDDEEELDETVDLPEGTITEISGSTRPSWLVLQEREKTITIKPVGECYEGYFKWQKADISCDGKDISVLAVVEGTWDGIVYYRNDPHDFAGIETSVFIDKVYCQDDGDSYDTQENDYLSNVQKDVANITGVYSVTTLLEGMSALHICLRSIKEIYIEDDSMRIVTDEGEKTVKIAA
jgi:hypothetical protein